MVLSFFLGGGLVFDNVLELVVIFAQHFGYTKKTPLNCALWLKWQGKNH